MTNRSIIASGNLATPRRTVTGILGQMMLLDIRSRAVRQAFADHGLPQQALQEPDFPISLEQELRVYSDLIADLPQQRSPATLLFGLRERMNIDSLGILGLLMRHAQTPLDSLHVCLKYPQLTWGHSRLVARREGGMLVLEFTMERPRLKEMTPGEVSRLVQFCTLSDVLSSMRNIEGMLERSYPALRIELPFAEPGDWPLVVDPPACEVVFGQDAARLIYHESLEGESLPRANPLLYRSYTAIADKLALMLAEEISATERVTRWLWACSPPLQRGEIARQLAVSERTLTRQLAAEGTSYKQLLSLVQQQRASNLLHNSSLSVTEVAERLGYAEPAAFSRAFRAWTGQSPLRWRKQQAQP